MKEKEQVIGRTVQVAGAHRGKYSLPGCDSAKRV